MTTIPPRAAPSEAARCSVGHPLLQVDDLTEESWSSELAGFADANFYQTRAYGAVSWGTSQLSQVRLVTDSQTVALAQLRRVTLPILQAGVAYLRWGPCCQRAGAAWDAAAYRAAVAARVQEYGVRRGLLLRLIPNVFEEDSHASDVRSVLHEFGFQRDETTPAYRTIRVDLTAESAEIRKRLDGKWRNQLNGAERAGLTLTEGTGLELYDQFKALYDEMMSRKQFETSVDVDEFRCIQQRLPEPQKMQIMISSRDGVPLTGLVATSVGDTGIYLLGATSNEGMKSKGSYLLQWLMMNRLKERGCRWYDLGGINPDTNPGVYHFKQGMGGQECRQLGCFVRRGSVLSTASVLAAERLRMAWSRLRRSVRPRAGAASVSN